MTGVQLAIVSNNAMAWVFFSVACLAPLHPYGRSCAVFKIFILVLFFVRCVGYQSVLLNPHPGCSITDCITPIWPLLAGQCSQFARQISSTPPTTSTAMQQAGRWSDHPGLAWVHPSSHTNRASSATFEVGTHPIMHRPNWKPVGNSAFDHPSPCLVHHIEISNQKSSPCMRQWACGVFWWIPKIGMVPSKVFSWSFVAKVCLFIGQLI